MKSNCKLITTISNNGEVSQIYRDERKEIQDDFVFPIQEEKLVFHIKACEKCLDKKNHRKKIETIKISIFITLLFLLSRFVKYKINEYFDTSRKEIIDYEESKKETEDRICLLDKCMENNKTLSSDLRNDLKQYMDVFAKYDSDFSVVSVANQIRSMDFSSKEAIDLQVLFNLFSFPNGSFVAKQLYWNQQSYFLSSYSYEGLLSYYLFFHEEALETILSGEALKLEINGKKYLIDLDKLDVYSPEVYDFFETFQKKKMEEIPLSSDYRLATNVFSSVVKAYSVKRNPSCYFEKEANSFVDCTDEFYLNELSKIINKQNVSFDCYEEKSRQLFYFYADAFLRTNGIRTEQEDLASFVYYTIKMDESTCSNRVFSYSDLCSFLEGSSFPYKHTSRLSILASLENSMEVLQMVYRCMKIDFLYGNLSATTFERFVNGVESCLQPELKKEFYDKDLDYDSTFESILRLEVTKKEHQ